jgi:hypothetical protein
MKVKKSRNEIEHHDRWNAYRMLNPEQDGCRACERDSNADRIIRGAWRSEDLDLGLVEEDSLPMRGHLLLEF